MKKRRDEWFEKLGDVKVKDLVFIDEFGTSTQMQRTHGRAPKGERVKASVPHGHWKKLSTVAAMSTQGVVACATVDGAIDGELFEVFVREALVPGLRRGQVLILDNASIHKRAEVRRLVEACGARVVDLPPYSPDLNPIELAISKIKQFLRSRSERTIAGLFSAIGKAVEQITVNDATNYMRHRGYAVY